MQMEKMSLSNQEVIHMKDKKTIAQIMGNVFGTILVGCGAIAVLGLTLKFLMWLF